MTEASKGLEVRKESGDRLVLALSPEDERNVGRVFRTQVAW